MILYQMTITPFSFHFLTFLLRQLYRLHSFRQSFSNFFRLDNVQHSLIPLSSPVSKISYTHLWNVLNKRLQNRNMNKMLNNMLHLRPNDLFQMFHNFSAPYQVFPFFCFCFCSGVTNPCAINLSTVLLPIALDTGSTNRSM